MRNNAAAATWWATCLLCLTLAATPASVAASREFFLRVNTIETSGIKVPTLETAPDQLVLLLVDGVERAEYPSFVANLAAYNYDWTSNIIDGVSMGSTLKFWVQDYQQTTDTPDPSTMKSKCWGYIMGCTTALYRELTCRWMYEGFWAGTQCADKSAATCTAALPSTSAYPDTASTIYSRYTWAQCEASYSQCQYVRTKMDGLNVDGFCGAHSMQNLGYAAVTMPTDAQGWDSTLFGNRTHWSDPQEGTVNLGGKVGYRVQLWATQCEDSEYLSIGGNCLTCRPGQMCNGVGQTACAAGSFSAAGASECTKCPAGSFQAYEGQAACAPCPAGTFAGAEGQTQCAPCAGGHYGGAPSGPTGFDADTCAGPCTAGYFCPAGSTSSAQHACGGADRYCPAGSANYRIPGEGEYTTPGAGDAATRTAVATCPAGYKCVNGERQACGGVSEFCPGGGSTSVRCPAGNYTTGGADANKRTGCAGCPAGSACDGAGPAPGRARSAG